MENRKENFEKPIEIMVAKPEDAKGIQDVFYKTWLATYPNEKEGITVDDIEDRYKDRYSQERIKKRQESITNPEKDTTMFVAKEGERVVGVCRVVIEKDQNRLGALYVLPEYQGRGIGTVLWKRAEKIFDKQKDILVNVATYNGNAISFYRKFGFVETGKRWRDEKFKMKSGATIPEMEMIKTKAQESE